LDKTYLINLINKPKNTNLRYLYVLVFVIITADYMLYSIQYVGILLLNSSYSNLLNHSVYNIFIIINFTSYLVLYYYMIHLLIILISIFITVGNYYDTE
jgi:hypothetical protein